MKAVNVAPVAEEARLLSDTLRILRNAAQLVGVVDRVAGPKDPAAFIRPLEDLYDGAGQLVSELRAPRRSNNREEFEKLEAGDHVSFEWVKHGEDSDSKDPIAIHVRKLTQSEAEKKQADNEIQFLNKVLNQAREAAKRLEGVIEAVGSLEETRKELQVSCDLMKEQLALKEGELKRREEVFEKYKILLEPLLPPVHTLPSPQSRPLDTELALRFGAALRSHGLVLPDWLSNCFLLSALAAIRNRRFMLLAGPVGTGKTSIVGIANRILAGANASVIPVRPGWLDTTDLLGFFDPLANFFRGTPFFEAVRAPRPEDLPHFVCLDEMNLARIENYAADFLSRHEHGEPVPLFAKDQLDRIRPTALMRGLTELLDLASDEQRAAIEDAADLIRLDNHELPIPRNVLFTGTLNSDYSTLEVSPKMVDRSFAMIFPKPDLLGEGLAQDTDPSVLPTSVQSILECPTELSDAGRGSWNLLVAAFLDFGPCAIPLSHRVRQDFQVFVGFATRVGVSENDAIGYFVLTRLLPRIRFVRQDAADAETNGLIRFVEDWCENSIAVHESAARLLAQLRERDFASYWTI